VDELNGTRGNKSEATTDPKRIKEADFVIIAVPTPVTKAKDPDMEPVELVSKIVGRSLNTASFHSQLQELFLF
jgi:UDPglucose 6-dehydrogenase/UDP-N-acetyl-D-galactosamine dehydrogenase